MNGSVFVVVVLCLLIVAFLVYFVRPLGDVFVRLAGADHQLLREHNVDRNYHLGMGLALLFSSTISSVALVIATAVATDIEPLSVPMVTLACVYFYFIFALDRWLVSDQTAGFAPRPDSRSRSLAWVGHFLIELFKVVPRVAVVYVASLLFANFILLVVFEPEIHEQAKAVERQEQEQFEAQIIAEVERRTKHARGQLDKAADEKKSVDTNFSNGTKAVQEAAKQRSADLEKLNKMGIKCREVYRGYWATNSRGVRYRAYAYAGTECPQEIEAVNKAYADRVAKFPQTQGDVQAVKAKIDEKYGVSKLTEYVKSGARDEVVSEWATFRPASKDGLLVRMRSLDLLTSPPSGPCDMTKEGALLTDNCTSRYSERAAEQEKQLRIWILLLEMLPVVMKFVNALLPRRGYASIMAARDEAAKAEAEIKLQTLRNKVRLEVERLRRVERISMEVEAAEYELNVRELARERRRVSWRPVPHGRARSNEQHPAIVGVVDGNGHDGEVSRRAVAWSRLKFSVAKVRAFLELSKPKNRAKKKRVVDQEVRAVIEQDVRQVEAGRPSPRPINQGRRVIDSEEHL